MVGLDSNHIRLDEHGWPGRIEIAYCQHPERCETTHAELQNLDMSHSEVPRVIEQLTQSLQALVADEHGGSQVVLATARALVSALESPGEKLTRLSTFNVSMAPILQKSLTRRKPTLFIAVRMGVGLDL